MTRTTSGCDLGVDPDDPDWERIGYDWLRPLDEAARGRLERTLIARGYAGQAEV